MRTVNCRSRLLGGEGVICPGGVCPGWSAQGGGGVCPSECWDTPPLWTEFLTRTCENITFPQLHLQMVNIAFAADYQPVYNKCQRQLCGNSAMIVAILFSLKSMETLENGLQPHSGASSLSCRNADADDWRKRAFIARIRKKFCLPITLIISFSMNGTKRQILKFPRHSLHYLHKKYYRIWNIPCVRNH